MPAPRVADGPLNPDTGADEVLDRFARMASTALGVPVSLVTTVGEDGQRFPGAIGLPEPWQSRRETPLSHSICQYVQRSGKPYVSADIRADPLTADSLAAPVLGVVAYAGVPLRTTPVDSTEPEVVGVLCAIDTVPRQWNVDELSLLEDIAGACSTELQLRRQNDEAAIAARKSRLLLVLSQVLADVTSPDTVAVAVRAFARKELGASWVGLLLADGNRGKLVLAGGPGDGIPEEWRSYPLSRNDHPGTPAHEVLRGRRVLTYPTAELWSAAFPPDMPAEVRPHVGSAVVLPLLLGRDVHGAAVVTWEQEREFLDDVELVEGLGRITTQALVRTQLAAERRTAAEVLQRSLLTKLPTVAGLDLHARYVTAGGDAIGGDWYDALLDTDGSVSVVIGDVTGHDVTAAATMGQLRGTLRAFAADRSDDPAGLVQRLDRTLPTLQISGMATLVAGRVELPTDEGVRFCWTNAGHPPPAVLAPDGDVQFLARPPELLVGVLAEVERSTHDVILTPGSTLLLYTDGLVEHRGRSLRQGMENLRRLLSAHHTLPLPDLMEHVILDLVGGHPDDDCALLGIRIH